MIGDQSARAKNFWWGLGWVSALVVLAVMLALTAVPAVFTIDDCHHLTSVDAMRAGGFVVPGTAGLAPTRALMVFDPAMPSRSIDVPAVTSTVPPLYGFLALPWSPLGNLGLVLFNALAICGTAAMVGWYIRYLKGTRRATIIAAGAFLLGGYVLEYAQGIWPHGLSLALTTAGFLFATRARREDRIVAAVAAGIVLGVAAGVRYQNVVFAASVALTLLIWHRRRYLATAAFSGALALPLVGSSWINHQRFDSWNPISEGPSRATLGVSEVNPVVDRLLSFYYRIIDQSAMPPYGDAALQDPDTGAWLFMGGIKKAWLQSSPWLTLVFAAMAIAWMSAAKARARRKRLRHSADLKRTEPSRSRMTENRELRALSVPVIAMVVLFTLGGASRVDGISFNQRHLLELMPLSAMALGVMVLRRPPTLKALAIGLVEGIVLALPFLLMPPGDWMRTQGLSYVPWIFAAAGVVLWVIVHRSGRVGPMFGAGLGILVGYSVAVHVGDDLRASRAAKQAHLAWMDAARDVMTTEPTVVVLGSEAPEGVCSLRLERDLVLVDPAVDEGRDVSGVLDALEKRGRRVYFAGQFPSSILEPLVAQRPALLLSQPPLVFATFAGQVPVSAPTNAK